MHFQQSPLPDVSCSGCLKNSLNELLRSSMTENRKVSSQTSGLPFWRSSLYLSGFYIRETLFVVMYRLLGTGEPPDVSKGMATHKYNEVCKAWWDKRKSKREEKHCLRNELRPCGPTVHNMLPSRASVTQNDPRLPKEKVNAKSRAYSHRSNISLLHTKGLKALKLKSIKEGFLILDRNYKLRNRNATGSPLLPGRLFSSQRQIWVLPKWPVVTQWSRLRWQGEAGQPRPSLSSGTADRIVKVRSRVCACLALQQQRCVPSPLRFSLWTLTITVPTRTPSLWYWLHPHPQPECPFVQGLPLTGVLYSFRPGTRGSGTAYTPHPDRPLWEASFPATLSRVWTKKSTQNSFPLNT